MPRSNLHMIGWVIMVIGERQPLKTGAHPHRSSKVYRYPGRAAAIAKRKLAAGTYRVEPCYIPRFEDELGLPPLPGSADPSNI